jgi:hypothetical protein
MTTPETSPSRPGSDLGMFILVAEVNQPPRRTMLRHWLRDTLLMLLVCEGLLDDRCVPERFR